jgi:hypothetical protein
MSSIFNGSVDIECQFYRLQKFYEVAGFYRSSIFPTGYNSGV